MRASKKHSTALLPSIVLVLVGASACKSDTSTGLTASDPELSFGRSVPAYTSEILPLLAGENQSRSTGVNDAGEVVGNGCCTPFIRAFARLGGVVSFLPGDNTRAQAISNGAVRYVVGSIGNPPLPVRWEIAGGGPGQPTYLAVGNATSGLASGVNDAGSAVGSVASQAAMWDADGNLTLISPPAGFVTGYGRDVSNQGHAVFVFTRPDAAWPNGLTTGYLRLASGVMVPLLPLTAGGSSTATGVSLAVGDLIKVSGTTRANSSVLSQSAVRWTVNIATEQIVATEVRPQGSYAAAISDAGIVAGYVQDSRGGSSAFRWENANIVSLIPPRGIKNPTAFAISPNGLLVAGEGAARYPRALLWTFPSL
ncbi:MAG TPA: hypothetical protein VM939_02985 [Gemmatimonadaceae bacterium]|nr:hypothetical protein [Gemmatimonadaceae bacterium]